MGCAVQGQFLIAQLQAPALAGVCFDPLTVRAAAGFFMPGITWASATAVAPRQEWHDARSHLYCLRAGRGLENARPAVAPSPASFPVPCPHRKPALTSAWTAFHRAR